MSAFACMYFQDPSLLAFQKRLENKLQSSNLKTLFDVKAIPKDTQLREVLDGISTENFSDVFSNMFEQLRCPQYTYARLMAANTTAQRK